MDTDLIKVVNKLQDTFNNLGGELDMPQLVVVGSQSAGKSSVLENIVGRDFLPRGQGIVTRRPLVLQLIHTPVSESDTFGITEWGQFLHVDKRFTDFAEIRKEIEQETFRVAGQNKGISKLPISLRIYSPNVLDLTLVDLPGLTKIPVGDQPSDIERQIRTLVLDYITRPNCVILAVSPANVDLANSESLKLARSVDPQGRRTIGVLTKLDLMDAGTNALDILTGRVYPLKLGFIGVVNRSQLDITSEKSMPDALETEKEFFQNHTAYRNIAHKNGTKYLAKTLNQVLMNHIRDKLPDMKARLNTLMGQAQQELNSFGDSAIFGDKNQQGALILRLMTQFARDFVSSVEGTSVTISTKELSGGARVYYIFNDVFGQALASIDAMQNLDNQDIRTAIRNSTGPRPSLFVPEIAFDLLVKPQIKLLEAPSLRCVELVYEELVKICHNCTSTELQRFPKLHAQLVEVVSELLRERLSPTSEYAASLIEIQAAYINTNHPAFISGSALAAQHVNTAPSVTTSVPAPPRARVSNSSPSLPSGPGSDWVSSSTPASQPASTEPLNGYGNSTSGITINSPSVDEDNIDSGDEHPMINGTFSSSSIGQRESRSVSVPYNDRSRTPTRTTGSNGAPNMLTGTSALSKQLSSAKSRQHRHSDQHHHSSNISATHRSHSVSGRPGNSLAGGSSPPSARETFLNYFFGQNGPGPVTVHDRPRDDTPSRGFVPVGREVSAADPTMSAGLMAGKRSLDGNNAAYDMKSLGKHIEAIPSDGSSHLTVREEMETSLIRSLICSYFGIVRQTIQDLIPKAIMHFLVNHTSQHVQNRLVASLYKPELFADLLDEDEALVAERTRVKALLDAYKEAFKVLSDVSLKTA